MGRPSTNFDADDFVFITASVTFVIKFRLFNNTKKYTVYYIIDTVIMSQLY